MCNRITLVCGITLIFAGMNPAVASGFRLDFASKLAKKSISDHHAMIKLDPTRTYPHETESRTIVRFQDCDPLQHLNNAKYFDYYFNAREDQVATQYNFSPAQLFREYKTSWVVYQHQIAYVRPATVNEWLRIVSRIIYVSEDTIVTEYYMTDDSGRQLKNVLWMTSKYVSVVTGRRIPHDPDVMAFLSAICMRDVVFHNLNFNDRIRQIKEELVQEKMEGESGGD